MGRLVFDRIAFNMAISNHDDHARNHAAFWNGHQLTLTPAYDLAPGIRSGETASQAMAYGLNGQRESTFSGLIDSCSAYDLTREEARARIEAISESITTNWSAAADLARLREADRSVLRRNQILHPGATRGVI